MAVHVSQGVAVLSETLTSVDPRIAQNAAPIDHTGATDSTAGLQAAANLLVAQASATDKSLLILPGLIKKSSPININVSNANNNWQLLGSGSGKQNAGDTTVIQDTVDGGAGTYSLNITSSAAFAVGGFSLIGYQGAHSPGDTHWGMAGIILPGACTLRNYSAQGYHGGIAVFGDHMLIEDFNVQGNEYGILVPPHIPTQGDVRLVKGRAGAAWKAAVGVARSSQIAGWRMIDVECSTSPYSFYRFDDASAASIAYWINGLEVINMATEYNGNGIVYNALSDTAGIGWVRFDHGAAGNLGLYSADVWVAQPQTAAWYNTGNINDLTFTGSLPSATATQPAVQCPQMARVLCYDADFQGVNFVSLLSNLTSGLYPLKATAGGSQYSGCAFGDRTPGRTLVVPYWTGGAVTAGHCLTNGSSGVVHYAGGLAQVYAIAGHSAASGSTVHGVINAPSASVVNTSASTIAANALLVPDAGGGVAAASGTYGSNGQVIGRMLASCLSGATGNAELFI